MADVREKRKIKPHQSAVRSDSRAYRNTGRPYFDYPHSAAHYPVAGIVELSPLIEQAGFGAFWKGESNSTDPLILLSGIAARTRTLRTEPAMRGRPHGPRIAKQRSKSRLLSRFLMIKTTHVYAIDTPPCATKLLLVRASRRRQDGVAAPSVQERPILRHAGFSCLCGATGSAASAG